MTAVTQRHLNDAKWWVAGSGYTMFNSPPQNEKRYPRDREERMVVSPFSPDCSHDWF